MFYISQKNEGLLTQVKLFIGISISRVGPVVAYIIKFCGEGPLCYISFIFLDLQHLTCTHRSDIAYTSRLILKKSILFSFSL